MADDDELLDRVRTGLSGVRPRGDALEVVRHQVRRRRRRRRVVATVASVAAAAVVVPAAVVALSLGDGGPDVEPAEPTPTAVVDGTRPAAFFVVEAGGRARAQLTRYRAAPGERYYSLFLWWPEVEAEAPVFAGAAVERYDGTAADACADVVAADGAGTCATTDGGLVARSADLVGPVRVDAVNGRGRLDGAGDDDAVRAVTVFRDDGWAVSLVLCSCVAFRGDDLAEPPLTAEQLVDVAAAPAWVPSPEGPSD